MFRYAGWGCIRLAASGGGFDDDLPDLFVGKPGHYVAIEAKYRSDRDSYHYADLEEIEQVNDFADTWGVTDRLWAARFPQDTTWYFLPVELMQTTSKSVKWSYEEVKEEWVTMDYFDLVAYNNIPDDFTAQ